MRLCAPFPLLARIFSSICIVINQLANDAPKPFNPDATCSSKSPKIVNALNICLRKCGKPSERPVLFRDIQKSFYVSRNRRRKRALRKVKRSIRFRKLAKNGIGFEISWTWRISGFIGQSRQDRKFNFFFMNWYFIVQFTTEEPFAYYLKAVIRWSKYLRIKKKTRIIIQGIATSTPHPGFVRSIFFYIQVLYSFPEFVSDCNESRSWW